MFTGENWQVFSLEAIDSIFAFCHLTDTSHVATGVYETIIEKDVCGNRMSAIMSRYSGQNGRESMLNTNEVRIIGLSQSFRYLIVSSSIIREKNLPKVLHSHFRRASFIKEISICGLVNILKHLWQTWKFSCLHMTGQIPDNDDFIACRRSNELF